MEIPVRWFSLLGLAGLLGVPFDRPALFALFALFSLVAVDATITVPVGDGHRS